MNEFAERLLRNKLEAMGFPNTIREEMHRHIAAVLAADHGPEPHEIDSVPATEPCPEQHEVETEIYRWLRGRIVSDGSHPRDFFEPPLVLIGPEGAGKSRLLFRIAARKRSLTPKPNPDFFIFTYKGRPAIETAFFEQKSRKESHTIKVRSLPTRERLRETVRKYTTDDRPANTCVFIDLSTCLSDETAEDGVELEPLPTCFAKTLNILVLSAHASLEELRKTHERFADWKIASVIFTHVAEARSLGPALTFLLETGLPLHFSCNDPAGEPVEIHDEVDWLVRKAGIFTTSTITELDWDDASHLRLTRNSLGLCGSAMRMLDGFLPPELFRALLIGPTRPVAYTWIGRNSEELIEAFKDRSFENVAAAILWFSSDDPGVMRESRLAARAFAQRGGGGVLPFAAGVKPYSCSSREFIVMTAFLTARDPTRPPLPYVARDLEGVLMGLLLTDPEAAAMITERLSPRDFSDPRHQVIYQYLYTGHQPLPPDARFLMFSFTLEMRFAHEGKDDAVSWDQTKRCLTAGLPALAGWLETKDSFQEAAGGSYFRALYEATPGRCSRAFVEGLIERLRSLNR